MKFIINAQLPRKLVYYLNEKGCDSIHTLDLQDKNASSDSFINQISLKENRIVIFSLNKVSLKIKFFHQKNKEHVLC